MSLDAADAALVIWAAAAWTTALVMLARWAARRGR
jgi:hypothetical protein